MALLFLVRLRVVKNLFAGPVFEGFNEEFSGQGFHHTEICTMLCEVCLQSGLCDQALCRIHDCFHGICLIVANRE